MPTLPLSVAAWSEPPTTATAPALVRLTPYLTTDGWWLHLGPGDAIPSGAIQGADVDDGAGGVTFDTPAGLGATILQPITAADGTLFLVDP